MRRASSFTAHALSATIAAQRSDSHLTPLMWKMVRHRGLYNTDTYAHIICLVCKVLYKAVCKSMMSIRLCVLEVVYTEIRNETL